MEKSTDSTLEAIRAALARPGISDEERAELNEEFSDRALTLVIADNLAD